MRLALAILLVSLAPGLVGCDGGVSEQVVATNLTGMVPYRGDWLPIGAENMSWSRPVYSREIAMNPSVYASPDWQAVLLTRWEGGKGIVEINGRPIATGQIRQATWTLAGAAQVKFKSGTLEAAAPGTAVGECTVEFSPDLAHWMSEEQIVRPNVGADRVIHFDGKEVLRIPAEERRGRVVLAESAAGQWVPFVADTVEVGTAWKDTAGNPAPKPSSMTRPADPPPPIDVVVKDDRGGPHSVSVAGRTIGTYVYVIRGSTMGYASAADRSASLRRFGVDPQGNVVFYAINGAGQIIRVQMTPP